MTISIRLNKNEMMSIIEHAEILQELRTDILIFIDIAPKSHKGLGIGFSVMKRREKETSKIIHYNSSHLISEGFVTEIQIEKLLNNIVKGIKQ